MRDIRPRSVGDGRRTSGGKCRDRSQGGAQASFRPAASRRLRWSALPSRPRDGKPEQFETRCTKLETLCTSHPQADWIKHQEI